MKVKLSSLKVAQLDKLLKERNLARSGNKAEKIATLMAACGADDVEIDDAESQDDFLGFDELAPNNGSLEVQMTELKQVVMSLAQSVRQLSINSGRTASTANTQSRLVSGGFRKYVWVPERLYSYDTRFPPH